MGRLAPERHRIWPRPIHSNYSYLLLYYPVQHPRVDFRTLKSNIGPISAVPTNEDDSDINLDLGQALGADGSPSHQVLRLYIPDRGRDGQEIGDQRRWVLLAASLLARIGGGVNDAP